MREDRVSAFPLSGMQYHSMAGTLQPLPIMAAALSTGFLCTDDRFCRVVAGKVTYADAAVIPVQTSFLRPGMVFAASYSSSAAFMSSRPFPEISRAFA